ncbi:hypothetical protein A0H81_12994 [Grifola frondosa]|uniref:Uncharacterized protein n=1 Tax=Grifola frondosa TaxID=5627 RepID=A0A1C7LQ91_GRIFR|nr:hypothetical protein A0H81_12994 [Grifola frondosa]
MLQMLHLRTIEILPEINIEITTPKNYAEVIEIDCSDSEIDSAEHGVAGVKSVVHHSVSSSKFMNPITDVEVTVCPGSRLDWPLDHFFQSYPFQCHESTTLGYNFVVSIRMNPHSMLALTSAQTGLWMDSRVLNAKMLARYSSAYRQWPKLLKERDELLNECKLENLNLGRQCATFLKKLDDQRWFVMAIATGDVPRLQHLVQQGLKEKVSITEITNRIEDTLMGLYQARGYQEMDLDVALLMPTEEDLMFNMKEIFECKVADVDTVRPFRTGASIFWDEISQKEVACYLPHADSVGGLCCEHIHHVNVQLASYESAILLVEALDQGVVHYGKETSVIALGSFGQSLRGAYPMVISSTCKAETPAQSGALLTKFIGVWNIRYAALFGPIWSFASDGDAGRRAMVYDLFMKKQLDPTHTLYKYLGNLPGLNLSVGDGDITGDFDWKHEIKRFGRLLRTFEGSIITDSVINHETLLHHLHRNDNLSEWEVKLLLNPADPQDVPHAIDFLQAISAISSLPNDHCNPTELKDIQIIRVLSELLAAFMNPFIQPEWSLTMQVTLLSKYAHMAFMLFRSHGVNFMPAQLYGDTQVTIKNIMFCITKQQELDNTQPFYIFDCGDDKLENLFGRIRMQGGHNPNFNLKQIAERAGAAMDLDAVFTHHPNLDRGHRRLKVTWTEKIDHLNHESWTGNVFVHSVNLQYCWARGHEAAQEALHTINKSVDFHILLKDGLDFLRPFGDGKYPGVSMDTDRSLEPGEAGGPPNVSSNTPGHCGEVPPQALPVTSTAADDSDVATPLVISSEGTVAALDEDEISDLTDLPPTISPQSSDSNPADDHGEVIRLEDQLEEPMQLQLPPPTNVRNPSAWLLVGGVLVHKATICRLIIMPEYARKSHERLLRVQVYSSDIKMRNWNTSNILDTDAFIVGDLFATFIICGNKVCLAILKCIFIEEKNVRVDHVDGKSLPHAIAGVKLAGQILHMRSVSLGNADLSSGNETLLESSWIWDGCFARLNLNQMSTPTGKGARKMLVVKVSSHLCESINPLVVNALNRLPPDVPQNLNSFGLTWEISEAEMSCLNAKLWASIQKHNALALLPAFQPNDHFPYRDSAGHLALISEDASRALEEQRTQANAKFRCYQCHKEIDPKKARNHVGGHILRTLRGVSEVLPGGQIGPMPCGFCGRSGITSCQQIFVTKGKNLQATTNCSHFRAFQYGPSLQSTDSTASTNIPMLCPFAGCTQAFPPNLLTAVWKYNMPEHIRLKHSDYLLDGTGPPLPDGLKASIFISHEEGRQLKIPEQKIPPKTIPLPMSSSSAPARGRKRKAVEHSNVEYVEMYKYAPQTRFAVPLRHSFGMPNRAGGRVPHPVSGVPRTFEVSITTAPNTVIAAVPPIIATPSITAVSQVFAVAGPNTAATPPTFEDAFREVVGRKNRGVLWSVS